VIEAFYGAAEKGGSKDKGKSGEKMKNLVYNYKEFARKGKAGST